MFIPLKQQNKIKCLDGIDNGAFINYLGINTGDMNWKQYAKALLLSNLVMFIISYMIFAFKEFYQVTLVI